MHPAWLLAAAAFASFVGMGWFALAKEAHWRQARAGAPPLPRRHRMLLQGLGALALALALALCLAADHPTMAALVWVMLLAASGFGVAVTLAWRPAWLALLVLRPPFRRGA